jgi:hypothetical protein
MASGFTLAPALPTVTATTLRVRLDTTTYEALGRERYEIEVPVGDTPIQDTLDDLSAALRRVGAQFVPAVQTKFQVFWGMVATAARGDSDAEVAEAKAEGASAAVATDRFASPALTATSFRTALMAPLSQRLMSADNSVSRPYAAMSPSIHRDGSVSGDHTGSAAGLTPRATSVGHMDVSAKLMLSDAASFDAVRASLLAGTALAAVSCGDADIAAATAERYLAMVAAGGDAASQGSDDAAAGGSDGSDPHEGGAVSSQAEPAAAHPASLLRGGSGICPPERTVAVEADPRGGVVALDSACGGGAETASIASSVASFPKEVLLDGMRWLRAAAATSAAGGALDTASAGDALNLTPLDADETTLLHKLFRGAAPVAVEMNETYVFDFLPTRLLAKRGVVCRVRIYPDSRTARLTLKKQQQQQAAAAPGAAAVDDGAQVAWSEEERIPFDVATAAVAMPALLLTYQGRVARRLHAELKVAIVAAAAAGTLANAPTPAALDGVAAAPGAFFGLVGFYKTRRESFPWFGCGAQRGLVVRLDRTQYPATGPQETASVQYEVEVPGVKVPVHDVIADVEEVFGRLSGAGSVRWSLGKQSKGERCQQTLN